MSKVTRALKRLRAERKVIEARLADFRSGQPHHAFYAAKLRAIDVVIAEKESQL